VVDHRLICLAVVEDGPDQAPLVLVEILDRARELASALEPCRLGNAPKILFRKEQCHEREPSCIVIRSSQDPGGFRK